MTNNETLADIVAEMRDTCGDIADHEGLDCQFAWAQMPYEGGGQKCAKH